MKTWLDNPYICTMPMWNFKEIKNEIIFWSSTLSLHKNFIADLHFAKKKSFWNFWLFVFGGPYFPCTPEWRASTFPWKLRHRQYYKSGCAQDIWWWTCGLSWEFILLKIHCRLCSHCVALWWKSFQVNQDFHPYA